MLGFGSRRGSDSDSIIILSITVAAGALIAFTFSASPPLTLVPERVAWAQPITSTIEIPPISIMSPEGFADRFTSQRAAAWAIDTPAMFDDLSGELMIFPPVTVQVEQAAQVAPQDMEKTPLRRMAPTQPKPHDVCSKYGRKKVWYMRDGHRYWRCVT